MNAFVLLISRFLIAAIFIKAGIGKIIDPVGTKGYMASAGMHYVSLLYIGAIVCELGGGLLIAIGYRTKLAAWAVFVFMIPTTYIFHSNYHDKMQLIALLKNLAIMGGLLQVAVHGAGRMSADKH